MTTEFEPVIGLEIHAELLTHSKMFCGCPVVDVLTAEPNIAVCPVCVGLPGALPVANKRAVEFGIQVALALNCNIREFLAFARKNYFYPDLPKGYQISQHEFPIGYGGRVDVPLSDGTMKRVRIRRVHLEEDTAKLLHGGSGSTSLIDFNRSSVPLLEIVTEPDIQSAEEAMAYASTIRDVLRYLKVNTGDMEKGVLRLEANISIRPLGDTSLHTRTEVKNLNSFRSLGDGIQLEIERQSDIVRLGGKVKQQTLGWRDEDRTMLDVLRTKENADDYRYFPEPDLPPVPVSRDWVAQLRAGLPELPWARLARFCTALGMTKSDAEQLVGDSTLADYFEAVIVAAPKVPAKAVANWILGEFRRLLNESSTDSSATAVRPDQFAALIDMVRGGAITPNNGKDVLAAMFSTGENASAVVARLGFARVADSALLNKVAKEVVEGNPTQVAQYFGGKEVVFQWLLGQIMKVTKGQADAQTAKTALIAALDATRSTMH
jgi:aspartyl-tRNA(Asn)/glutamyl-tRNA(Gln) amidotransferase subunit B